MPLALAEAAAPSAPLDKGKRVWRWFLMMKNLLRGRSSNDKGQLIMPLNKLPLPLPLHMGPNP